MSRRMALGVGIGLLFVTLLVLRTDLDETWRAFREAEYGYVAPAVLLSSVVTVWLRAARWTYLLRPLVQTRTHRIYPILTVGYMANNLLPLRAGELVRAHLVRARYGVRRMAVLGTIALERLFDGAILVALLIVAAGFVHLDGDLRRLAVIMAVLYLLAIGLVLLVAWSEAGSERLARRVLSRLPLRLAAPAGNWAGSFLTGLRAIRSPSALGLIAASSLAIWCIDALAYGLMGRAFGIEQGYATYLLIAAVANLSLTIPSSQGGIGPFEFFAREVLVVSGVGVPVATAYAIALHAVLLLPMVAAGLVIVWATDITLRGATGRDPGELDPAGPESERGLLR
ncbi:MAG: flippase-like domain-containing protein [Dehalococcoidia bacterium]|nr:flippase-like domain-containing protein [Dehalococcoidia bacterium]